MTYGKLSQLILDAYYKTTKSDNSNYSLRTISEYIAEEVAWHAKASAFEADHMGESMYANDQFIVTYTGLALQTDSNGNKYIPMPSVPAGLPQQREVAYVGFTGNKKDQVFPMRNKDLFMQQQTNTPRWMILYYVEGGNIVFYNLSSVITATVNLKLVGSVGVGSELVNIPINMPRDFETAIIDKILARLNSVRGVLPNNINNNTEK